MAANVTEEILSLCRPVTIWQAWQRFETALPELLRSPADHFRVLKALSAHFPEPDALATAMDRFDRETRNKTRDQVVFIAWAAIRQGKVPGGTDLDEDDRRLLDDAVCYLAAFPYVAARARAEDALSGSSGRFVDDAALGEVILLAAIRRIPFSFVRLGDGEGRCITDLDAYPALRRLSLDIARGIWFWTSPIEPPPAFLAALRDAYRNASAIGLNPPARIDLAYRNGITGYAGVVGGNEFAYRIRPARNGAPHFVRNWAFGSEVNSSLFPVLLRAVPDVTLIGPHRDFAACVAERFGVRASLIRVPSENHPLVAGDSLREPHYPDAFDRVHREIEARPPGLYLVAAGAFGKIYCEAIRRRGGVGLDIGSLADAWMGLATR